MQKLVEIKNLTKIYNGSKKAVDNISLDINAGEIVAFIGHNGAGKTTTIKCLMGILNYEAGKIIIDNKDLKSYPIECKMDLAYLPDNPEIYDNLTGIGFINFVCDMYNTPVEVREKNINAYAEMFNIKQNLNDEISSYSHGMKQKIALIAALSHEPKILVLDEPFVGLDPTSVFDLKKVMKSIAEKGGCVFFSTHILEVAEKLCDKVIIIKDGKIVKSGTMKDVKGDKSLEKVFLDLEESTK